MTTTLSDDQARRLRLRGQGLVSPVGTGPAAPVAVARQVCGLQAQDMFAATLGVRVRSTGATSADVERARAEDRTLVWTWAMRGTLHLLAREDLDWLLPLLGKAMVAAAARRRDELGLDEDTYQRGLRAVVARLREHGPATRPELAGALSGAGVPEGYRPERHLFYRAALEGVICMGPDRGATPTYVLMEDWLGEPLRPVATETALARLAERYLAAFAPATPADLAAWSGLPAADVRAGWQAVAGSLVEVEVAGERAWVLQSRLVELDEPVDSPHVRLLPAFDTYLLGHRSRALIVEPGHAKRINAGGGMIRPVLLVDGEVRGTWRPNRQGQRVRIEVEPFADLAPEAAAGVDAEITAIQRFLGR